MAKRHGAEYWRRNLISVPLAPTIDLPMPPIRVGAQSLLPVYWRPKGSAWGAIRRAFLQIATHAGPNSAIDCGARHQPYFLKSLWIAYP